MLPMSQECSLSSKTATHRTNHTNSPVQDDHADFFQFQGQQFLIIGDRLSGWTEVVSMKPGTASSGAKGLCDALWHVFVTFGVLVELSSDGGPEFTAQESIDFYVRWGTRNCLSSSYFPQPNGRAEVAVKVTKCLLEDNIGQNGKLNTDKVIRAMLQQHNTPNRDCWGCPADTFRSSTLRCNAPIGQVCHDIRERTDP